MAELEGKYQSDGYFKINAGEHIYILSKNNKTCSTKILELNADNTFTCPRPIEYNKGDIARIFFYRNRFSYSLKAKIDEMYTQFDVPMVRFKILDDTLTTEKRRHIRIVKSMPVKITVVSRNSSKHTHMNSGNINNIRIFDIRKIRGKRKEQFLEENIVKEIEAENINISLGGMKVLLPEGIHLDKGTKCKVAIDTPLKLNLTGIVVHSHMNNVGLQFVDMGGRDKSILSRFIYRQQAKAIR